MTAPSGRPRTVAIIPARGGSKRLPGKNLTLFDGRPLVVHSVEYALAHPAVDSVYVSTDDADIAEVARRSGARVIDRPTELAGDHATTSETLRHALGATEHPQQIDLVVTLQPTSPLRLPSWLDECLARLTDPRVDSAITVSPSPLKVGTVDDGIFRPDYELETRSQDIAPRFAENGLLYVTRSRCIAAGTVFGRRIAAVVIDHPFGMVDVDEAADLILAEGLLHAFRDAPGRSPE